jgi:hypothetical protein
MPPLANQGRGNVNRLLIFRKTAIQNISPVTFIDFICGYCLAILAGCFAFTVSKAITLGAQGIFSPPSGLSVGGIILGMSIVLPIECVFCAPKTFLVMLLPWVGVFYLGQASKSLNLAWCMAFGVILLFPLACLTMFGMAGLITTDVNLTPILAARENTPPYIIMSLGFGWAFWWALRLFKNANPLVKRT